MGSVYEAIDLALDRRVAIKTISLTSAEEPANVRKRFALEARVTGRLHHPNIVAVYDFGETEGLAFMVMEYLVGKTLGRHMSETEPLVWPKFLDVLRPCAQALDYAHGNGVVHLDIKPDNIMVTEVGSPKILDFGMARLAYHSRLTGDRFLVGTPLYLSPESLSGKSTNPASDQFSLAVIIYRLLAGKFPFSGEHLFETMHQTLTTRQVPVADLNKLVPDVTSLAVDRALSKDPALRFPTCVEFLSEALNETLMQRLESGPRLAVYSLPFLGAASERPGSVPPVTQPSFLTQSLAKSGNDDEDTREIRLPPQVHKVSPEELAAHQAEELIMLAREQRFQEVLTLDGEWLPGVDGAEPALLAIREAARYLLAAQNAGGHSAVEYLTRAQALLTTAGNQVRESNTVHAAEFPRTIKVWEEMTENQLQEARRKAASKILNPFRAGQPLRPDQGRALFRGRDNVVHQIETILMEADQSGSIALLGPRRCGKTSLLQMLPTLIPECLCVFFDLQDNPVESPQAFFEALYRQAREQARQDRRIDIPELKSGAFSAAMEWMQALDNMPHDLRVLLCLDEFERLEDLFPGDQQDVLRLMGLFRATIQHRKKLRLMVSGVAPFDELGQMWNDHFINIRQIRVGHLGRETAIDLLMHPVPDFPEDAVGPKIAAEVYARTGGQPYLLQLYGSLLIAQLNLKGERQATIEDIPTVEEEARSQGAYYLRNCYESAPEPARHVLEELACGRKPPLQPAIKRWLERRGLVDDQGNLAIPVLGAFMKEELGLQ
jgi:serine/threonine protein kinase